MKTTILLVLVMLLNSVGHTTITDPITVKQEVLGPWHYLYPLEFYEHNPTAPQWYRVIHPPTAITFGKGERIATMLPGSVKLAEFIDGVFQNLHFPEGYAPVSLATDRNGILYVLSKKIKKYPQGGYDMQAAYLTSFDPEKHTWSPLLALPVPVGRSSDFDRIQFDSLNRAWALGPTAKVGVLQHGKWDTYAYSNDRKLGFIPVRAQETNGIITLFSNYQGQEQTSRMKGTLVYERGTFTPHPEAVTQALCAAQKMQDDAVPKDDFDRSTGYVCHSTGALNVGSRLDTKTVLQTKDFILVSLGNDGLVWCRKAELGSAPRMSEECEWETVNDVIMSPSIDPSGALWMARDNPKRLICITAQGSREFPIPDEIKAKRHEFTLFDQSDRAWFLGFYGVSNATLFDPKDQKFLQYGSIEEAMRAHASDFKAGPVFHQPQENDRYTAGPGILKTKDGKICMGGPDFENFSILDGDKTLTFGPAEINPAQANNNGGHGYNPFQNGEPSEDENGDITTCVDNVVFAYHDGKWIKKGDYNQTLPVDASGKFVPADWVPDDPSATSFTTADGRLILYRGFHFYEKTPQGLKQIDSGLNPLAFYPFWKSWYSSPGSTKPRMDPTGRIWISALGPYAEDHDWLVLRNPFSP
jgi:hypothetical protein